MPLRCSINGLLNPRFSKRQQNQALPTEKQEPLGQVWRKTKLYSP
jgi:hypothetical protein